MALCYEYRWEANRLCYKYRWEGNRLLVLEYANGRLQHEYYGYMVDNGYSVDIYPIKGRRSYGEIPYEGKRIPVRLMERMELSALWHPEEEKNEYDPTAWNMHKEQSVGEQIDLLKGI